jgi:hypothetical protein
MPQLLGVFYPRPWYIYVRISSHRVFDLPTKELHHGKEGKEEESQEEEIVHASAAQNQLRRVSLAAGPIQPPFACALYILNGEPLAQSNLARGF